MKYEYTDEKAAQLLPNGEYVLEITKADFGFSDGAKSKGCRNLKVTVIDEVNGSEMQTTFTFPDEGTEAGIARFFRSQIDSFLKAARLVKSKGEVIEMVPETFTPKEPIRLWGKVVQKEIQSKKDPTKKFIVNQIEGWILKDLPDRPF